VIHRYHSAFPHVTRQILCLSLSLSVKYGCSTSENSKLGRCLDATCLSFCGYILTLLVRLVAIFLSIAGLPLIKAICRPALKGCSSAKSSDYTSFYSFFLFWIPRIKRSYKMRLFSRSFRRQYLRPLILLSTLILLLDTYLIVNSLPPFHRISPSSKSANPQKIFIASMFRNSESVFILIHVIFIHLLTAVQIYPSSFIYKHSTCPNHTLGTI
jgi:hypothetical protein